MVAVTGLTTAPNSNKEMDSTSPSVTNSASAQQILTSKKNSCPNFYGVRSYLHNFYEDQGNIEKDPRVFETEDEYALLLRPRAPRRALCRPLVWKIFVWIGINLLLFGIVGIFVSYLVPQKTVYTEYAEHIVIDRNAQNHNANLELVKLVGLLLFCVGGAITIVGLLVPTLMWRHCQEEYSDEGLRIRVTRDLNTTSKSGGGGAQISLAPGGQLISTKVDSVQPNRRPDECSIATQ